MGRGDDERPWRERGDAKAGSKHGAADPMRSPGVHSVSRRPGGTWESMTDPAALKRISRKTMAGTLIGFITGSTFGLGALRAGVGRWGGGGWRGPMMLQEGQQVRDLIGGRERDGEQRLEGPHLCMCGARMYVACLSPSQSRL